MIIVNMFQKINFYLPYRNVCRRTVSHQRGQCVRDPLDVIGSQRTALKKKKERKRLVNFFFNK